MNDFITRINWNLLREQKDWVANNATGPDPHEANGLLHLLDALQDYAVDECGIPENVVFGRFEE